MKVIKQKKKKISLNLGKKTSFILKFLVVFYFTMKATLKYKFKSFFMGKFFLFSHKKETLLANT